MKFPRVLDSWAKETGLKQLLSFLREAFAREVFGSFDWDPGSVGGFGVVDTTLTATDYPALEGLREGMAVTITPPASMSSYAGLMAQAWVPASDQLTIRLGNYLGGGYNMTEDTWTFSARNVARAGAE